MRRASASLSIARSWPADLLIAIAAWRRAGPRAQTRDERAAARDVVKKRGDAVVMVLATIKMRVNVGGREQTIDQAAQANGTCSTAPA